MMNEELWMKSLRISFIESGGRTIVAINASLIQNKSEEFVPPFLIPNS